MAGLTLQQAESKLQLYLTAEEAVLSGQEYVIGTRRLRRADLEQIREGIKYWDDKAKELAASAQRRPRVRVPTIGF